MGFQGRWQRGSVQDPAKTLWLGRVPEGTTYQELLEFCKEFGEAKWAEVYGQTAAVGFSSADVASSALGSVRGATFKGIELEADNWTRKDGSAADQPRYWSSSRGSGKGGRRPGYSGKGWGKGGGAFLRSRINDPTKTIWIGNIPAGVRYPELLELGKTAGEAKWADVWKNTGAIGYETSEEATSAISKLNGTELAGSQIVVDAWVRGAKKEQEDVVIADADGASNHSRQGSSGEGEAAMPATASVSEA